MAQGDINLVRDHILQYSTTKFASTEAFCKRFRTACVNYVGLIGPYGNHHALDCVFQLPDGTNPQPGPRLHAFCGGIPKNPDGKWPSNVQPTDYTRQLVTKSFSSTVKVKGGPISLKECLKFKKTHPIVTCA